MTTFSVGGHAVLHVIWDGVLGVTHSRDVSVFTFTRLLISTRNLRAPFTANTVVWNAGLGYVIPLGSFLQMLKCNRNFVSNRQKFSSHLVEVYHRSCRCIACQITLLRVFLE